MESNMENRASSEIEGAMENAGIEVRGKNAGTVAAISVAIAPAKRKYLLGSVHPDLAGGVLDVIYSDGTIRQVPMTNDMEAEPESLDVGDTNMIVRAFEKTAIYPVAILEPRVVKVTVLENQKKTEYEEGETLDLKGLILRALFNDESVKEVRGLEVAYELSKGEESVELNYMGAPFTVPVIVRKRAHEVLPVSLELASLPNKLCYKQGEVIFEPAGGMLLLQYSDGTRKPIPLADASIKGFDTSKAGSCELEASYQGFRHRFSIAVEPMKMIGLRVGGTAKSVYREGEPYSFAGLVVYAEYDNGSSEPVSDYSVDKQTASLGDHALTLSYHGFSCEVAVDVMPKQPQALAIIHAPHKRTYYVGDTEVLCEGGRLELSYENGIKECIPLEAEHLEPYSLTEPGSKTIVVSHAGLRAQFDIEVQEPPITGIEVAAMPKREYFEGEYFDASGLQIAALYANGFRRILASGAYQIQGKKRLSCLDTFVLVTYGTMAAIIPITVQAHEASQVNGAETGSASAEQQAEAELVAAKPVFYPFYPSTMGLRFVCDD